MDKNYFGLVCEAISQANRIKNFKKIKKDESNFEFQANEKHYLINLDSQKKLIILNIIDNENNSSKNLSSWLFDEDTLTQKDIDDIDDKIKLIFSNNLDVIKIFDKNITNNVFNAIKEMRNIDYRDIKNEVLNNYLKKIYESNYQNTRVTIDINPNNMI